VASDKRAKDSLRAYLGFWTVSCSGARGVAAAGGLSRSPRF
jgi:hypothetical protein